MRFSSEEAGFANTLPANLDDMYDYLTEVGDLKWRPIVPDALKPVLTQVGTEKAKPESPLVTKPPVPVKKPQP
jgi:hypothetical protein